MLINKRIDRLREHALKLQFNNIEWEYLYYKGYLEGCSKEFTANSRYAFAVQYMLRNVKSVIGEDELIVGKQSNRNLTQDEQTEFEHIKKYLKPVLNSVSSSAHMSLDFELLLSKGVTGILDDIDNRIKKLNIIKSEDVEKYEFYLASKIALNGLLGFAENYAELALVQANKCENEARKHELIRISNICRKVPRYPAESFYEALQACHILTVCVTMFPFGLYQLGRPDRYLIDYYRNDIKNMVITKEFAQELIDCSCMMYNEIVPSGLAVGFMVGGCDTKGKDTTNELTYMFIESIGHTRLVYPAIGLAYSDRTPDDLLDLSCKIIGQGYSHPAIFNDQLIVKGLKHYGVSENKLHNYIQSTCVEITPGASSSCWVASPYTNLVQILLDTLGVKEENSIANEYSSFQEFQNSFFKNLSKVIDENFVNHNRVMIERTKRYCQPLLSCFVNDCIERGVDIESGGARYNWIMPSFVGVANVADSFGVIEEMIFKRKRLNFNKLAEILEKNYVGFEKERLSFLNLVDKYGNDIEKADAYVNEITEWLGKKCMGYKNFRGGELIPSLFCWVMHEILGTTTMASPDGRVKGFPLGDGSGPAQGREKNGPTASVLSSTSWEQYPFIGGVAVNIKFSKKVFDDESKNKLMALIKTFIARNGFEMQINTIDKETLLKARENPDMYGDIVVRIGGYSDYFVRLSKAMQAEVIERTEHII